LADFFKKKNSILIGQFGIQDPSSLILHCWLLSLWLANPGPRVADAPGNRYKHVTAHWPTYVIRQYRISHGYLGW